MNSEIGSRPEWLIGAVPETLSDPISRFSNRSLTSKRGFVALVNDDAELINVILEYLERPDLAIYI